MPIERALVSVFDKTGLVNFARRLAAAKIEIVSTGGTARLLRENGLTVRDVSELTGWPEMLGGRVKTLHPKVHGGILFQRGKESDRAEAAGQGVVPIDLVVVNLYPFSATARKPNVTPEELIENIDIGGPAMVRSAAKNFESVAVITDPADYEAIAKEIESTNGVSLSTRLDLARKAYARTARYDGEIATELERLTADANVTMQAAPSLPQRLSFTLERRQSMRYGENPHQSAALYIPAGHEPSGLAGAKQLQGKELSYNNLVDLDAAWALAKEFTRPAVAIIKHNNPCGAAEKDNQRDAYLKALACDPVSAFGGVLAFNRKLDAATAEEVAKLFVECIAAPGYEPAALEKLAAKKNARVLEITKEDETRDLEIKRISGGVLIQDADRHELNPSELKSVAEREPTPEETARPTLRLESLQTRKIQRHSLRPRRRNHRNRRRPNEPRRLCKNRGNESPIPAKRHSSSQRRLLPLPRRRRRSRQSRRHRSNPTRRLGPRQRSNRRRQQTRHGYGLHQHPPF